MAPDRDHRRPLTPPAGVRAQTASPESEFEGETPVEGDAVTQINNRAGRAAASSKAAFGAIGELRRELRASVDRDVRDHQAMMTSSGKIETRVDEIGRHVGDLRESVGEMKGEVKGTKEMLQVLVDQLEQERQARADSARLRAVTEAEIKRADAVAEAEIKRASAVADAEIKKASKVAEIEVDKTAKVAAIEDDVDATKHKRARNMKIVAAIATVVTGMIGLLAHCG